MSETLARRELRITRVFDAPRDRVWRMWTDADRLATWWGKRGWNTPPGGAIVDARPGGTFRVRSIAEDDGREMVTEAVFREVLAPERLVFADAGGGVATVMLTDLGDGRTEMRFHTTVHASRAAEGGMRSAFDRLAEQLA